MDLSKVKKVYCLGIGGIGVSAIAKWFFLQAPLFGQLSQRAGQGREMAGWDLVSSEITDDLARLGILVAIGPSTEVRPPEMDGLDLVVYSPAVPAENPARQAARERGIKELSYPEVLGEISRGRPTIAVSGTNGKSTTTALVGLMLEAAGLDPLVIVGSKVKSFAHGNLRPGQGPFVVEACEHQANMLKIQPQTAILTNIEEDHLDYYRDLGHIKDSFRKFVKSLPPDGKLIFNADDPASVEVSQAAGRKISFGIDGAADYQASELVTMPGRQQFILRAPDGQRGTIVLQIPGRFNVYNALAALAAALENGANLAACQKVLAEFSGPWRRFEKVGEFRGATIISDYGHHPTAIRETLAGAREFYPGRRLVLVYQPHQHNRTKKLFNDFVAALRLPDLLILSDIYDVAGREEAQDQNVSSEKLVKEINKDSAVYGGDLENTLALAQKTITEGDIVIVMGAGDIDWVARQLIPQ